jgi:hypothetical protein
MTHTKHTYGEWLEIAATGGIDWDNPPPQELLTEALCVAALEDAPEHLAKIPDELKTFDVCFAAVYQDDGALEFVPQSLQERVKAKKDSITEEQWIDELSRYTGNHYLKLPKHLLTPEFCRNIVTLNGYTLALIPEDRMTPELHRIAGEQDKRENWLKNMRHGFTPMVKSGFQIVLENAQKKSM